MDEEQLDDEQRRYHTLDRGSPEVRAEIKGRPPEDRAELVPRMDAYQIPRSTPIIFYFCDGGEYDPDWEGLCIEVAEAENKNLHRALASSIDRIEGVFTELRVRLWRTGVDGFLEFWYDPRLKQTRYALRDFDVDSTLSVALMNELTGLLRRRARRGARIGSNAAFPGGIDGFIEACKAAVFEKNLTAEELTQPRLARLLNTDKRTLQRQLRTLRETAPWLEWPQLRREIIRWSQLSEPPKP